LSVEKALRDHERSHHVIGDHSAGISNDVGITMIEAQHLKDVHSAIHTCDNCQAFLWGQAKPMIEELFHEIFVVSQKGIGVG
jgi:hypothetical protein